ncbi:MAG: aminoglycoside 2-N-acetyltransferase, partial [Actinomycetota bacterium]|nr:aminoglycoside 2-N-acetyltransferase [Actinomycetota bacterium]
ASPDFLRDIQRVVVDAFDGRFSDDDWDHALGGTHVVVTEGDEILSHASVVTRMLDVAGEAFRAGYIEGVGTAPARQGQGLGSVAMKEITTLVRRDFEMGALSTDAQGFYEKLGWERWQGPTFVRGESGLIRTEDEDDGIMVLRFGRSEYLDLTAAISCEERSGDDW